MDDSFVVLSAVHPVAGRLYLEVIEESSVGLPDVYLVTDNLARARVEKAGWREMFDKSDDRERFSEWLIKRHLTAVEWDGDSIARLAERHALTVSDLWQWCSAVQRWDDLPVKAAYDEDRCIWEAQG